MCTIINTRNNKILILLRLKVQRKFIQPIPVAERSKLWVCGRSPAGIAGSNLAEGMDVCLLCVLSGRRLCDGLITRTEKTYRLCCVLVSDDVTSGMRRLKLVIYSNSLVTCVLRDVDFLDIQLAIVGRIMDEIIEIYVFFSLACTLCG